MGFSERVPVSEEADQRENRLRRAWRRRGAVNPKSGRRLQVGEISSVFHQGTPWQHNAPVVRERAEGRENLSELPGPVTVVA